jgi:hypothetical protein
MDIKQFEIYKNFGLGDWFDYDKFVVFLNEVDKMTKEDNGNLLEFHSQVSYTESVRYGTYHRPNEPYLRIRWLTGGQSGGNCWHEGGHSPIEADSEPNFDALELLIDRFAPELSHKNYLELEKMIYEDSDTEQEYYGNYSTYGIKQFYLIDLFQKLTEWGYLI